MKWEWIDWRQPRYTSFINHPISFRLRGAVWNGLIHWTPFHSPSFRLIRLHCALLSLFVTFHYTHRFMLPCFGSHLTNSKLPSIQYIHYTPSSLHSLLVSFSTFISLVSPHTSLSSLHSVRYNFITYPSLYQFIQSN